MSLEYPDGFQFEKHNKKPICGVVSVAICAGVSLEVARATLRADYIRRGGQRFRGGTNQAQRGRALSLLGVQFETHTLVGKMNLRNWYAKYGKPGVLYSVRVTGHVVTVKDGMVIDQHRHKPIWEHKSGGKMVSQWFVILGKGW